MNVSDKHKLIFIAPARTASRSISHIFWKELEFKSLVNDSSKFTHEVSYEEKYHDYEIITLTRNPYSKQVSAWQMEYWHHEKDYESFENYLRCNGVGYMYTEHGILNLCKTLNKKINYIVKYENMINDLLKIDLIKNNQDCLNKINFLLENNSKSSKIERLTEENGRFSNYKIHYTQELADIVFYENELVFKAFDYDKDSWK